MGIIPGASRGRMNADTLVKVVLVLVVVWLILQIAEEFTSMLRNLLGPFDNVIGLIIVVVIVLWLLDRI
ncbi:MAG: hypothetical protein V5A43_03050 [Haloarculaceae archaeon]